MIKIENITVNAMQKKLFHFSSSELNEVKMPSRKDFYVDALDYIEKYVNEKGFKLLNVYSVAVGVDKYVLLKE